MSSRSADGSCISEPILIHLSSLAIQCMMFFSAVYECNLHAKLFLSLSFYSVFLPRVVENHNIMSRSFLIDMHYTKFVDRDLLDLAFKDINQLQQIMRLTGTPPASLISRMPSHEVSSLWPSPLFAEYPSCPLISRPNDVSLWKYGHLEELKFITYNKEISHV